MGSGQERNLTGELESAFTNQEDDSLAKEKRPYSPGQWLADGSAVMLDDRFDVWLVKPDGSEARRLTDGRGEMIRHRISDAGLTREDDGLLDSGRPLFLSLHGERSKKSGYARIPRGWATSTAPPEVLIWEDCYVSDLHRAGENRDVFIYRKESFRDSPDLFLTGRDFAKS